MIDVREIYILLADNPGGEGLVMAGGLGVPTPVIMTGADRTPEGGPTLEHRLDELRRFARQSARAGARALRLVRFTVRQDIEVFHPDGRRERVA